MEARLSGSKVLCVCQHSLNSRLAPSHFSSGARPIWRPDGLPVATPCSSGCCAGERAARTGVARQRPAPRSSSHRSGGKRQRERSPCGPVLGQGPRRRRSRCRRSAPQRIPEAPARGRARLTAEGRPAHRQLRSCRRQLPRLVANGGKSGTAPSGKLWPNH